MGDIEIRPIAGHPLYGIGADGRVWSGAKGVWRTLALTLDGRGYPKVKLTLGKTVMVHLLVARAYLGEQSPGMTVNHKDGDKLNSAAQNLEYVTQAENNRHAWRQGLQRSGWETRRARLTAMGRDRYAANGSYPGGSGRTPRHYSEGGR